MSEQINSQTTILEQALINITRALPSKRIAQLLDFARFLEAQSLAEQLAQEEINETEIAAENERWDALLATPESQDLLDKLAEEALAEQQSGQTKEMRFTDEGRITPG